MRGREVAPVAEFYPPQGQWTEEDYFALPDANRIVELSEGKIIMPPHPTRSHQSALEEIFVRLRAFVLERELGEVHIAPLPVRLWSEKIREPDIFFLSKEHADKAGEKVYGVPDLVIEVLSPGTEQVDRGKKYLEYAKAGVREYWIVEPQKRNIEVYVLRGNIYKLQGKYKVGQLARSELLSGFEVDVGKVFQPLS